jgi:hypothetical protein
MQQNKQKPDVPDWKYSLIGIVAIIAGIAAAIWFLYCLFSWISQASDFLT